MKKLASVFLLLLAGSTFLFAQTNPGGIMSPEVQHNDSIILANIITPAVSTDYVPDWTAIGAEVQTKYGESYVDRTVTKARIYYYFGKEWPLFSKALVHYTEAYEDKDNLKLMNKNAKMVLKYSQNPDEWKAAMAWIKHAVDKEPGNADYKGTYDGLTMKIKGQAIIGGKL